MILFVLIAVFVGFVIYTNWSKTVEIKTGKTTITYNAKCWNCEKPVSSTTSVKCSKCNHFHCTYCDKCLCEKNFGNHSAPIAKVWKEVDRTNVSSSSITPRTKECSDCGKEIEATYTKCYACNRKSNDFAKCAKCGKKIESQYRVCYSCSNQKYKS